MMKRITISDVKKLTGVELVNAGSLRRQPVTGICTDSRTVRPGVLFVALKGETFDAHEFLDAVVKAAPAAVMVRRSWAETHGQYLRTFPCLFIIVPDTTIGYGELARVYRRKFDIPVIAVGGSNGKTTTKELVTAVLSAKYSVLSTEGNLNNHIGVPQTLFRITAKHDVAVVEIGTNHFGELAYLCSVAEPTHGLLTNIGKEHLEFFGDEAGVAKEELELFRYLQKHNGTAFVNADDRFLAEGSKGMKRAVRYGTAMSADVRAKQVKLNDLGQASFTIAVRKKETAFTVRLSAPGLHNVTNALAAAAIGLSLKVRPAAIATSLASFTAASKRMEVLSHNGVTILNDTYNSNPDSVLVALRTLAAFTNSGRKMVVLGDMRELGDASKREHTNIGAVVAEMKTDALYTFGPFSRYTAEACGARARHYEKKEELAADLRASLQPGDVVLVKGSRGMRMEEVVALLTGAGASMTMKGHH
ncbi:MAG: UDP-N-acetylmuramoyl-tripeptide--D-alanyl-D-alanine ligase [Bacteroidetes bacterium]|nr:UDP-N-acetylmuramoyl-tripeptide--D-alanyl-D-alanine ligase [Bacteroidota bacterium]